MADRMSDGCFDLHEPGETTLEPGWLDRAFRELAVPGEAPSETARRIRVELAALRAAVREANEQRDLANEAASKARDATEDALEDWRLAVADRNTERRRAHAAEEELRALEWLTLEGYPLGRGDDGRVMAVYREEDGEPDWKANWTEAAKACGWKP